MLLEFDGPTLPPKNYEESYNSETFWCMMPDFPLQGTNKHNKWLQEEKKKSHNNKTRTTFPVFKQLQKNLNNFT